MFEVKRQLLNEDLKKQIDEGFGQHARAVIGHDEIFDPVAFVAHDKGCFAGAIVVGLFWGALHVKKIYVGDEYRGKGIGSQLMEYALKYGRDNKCSFAFVETMSFQALDFYRKMGFELEFTRLGYKHDTSFHYLRREIKEEG
ncbi:MAG: GNAT family N-acetyltransferase [Chlamydiota bacterium]